eukprot:UN25220
MHVQHLVCNLKGINEKLFESIIFVCIGQKVCDFLNNSGEKLHTYVVVDKEDDKDWDNFRANSVKHILLEGYSILCFPPSGIWFRDIFEDFTIDFIEKGPDLYLFGDWQYPFLMFRNMPESVILWENSVDTNFTEWKLFVNRMNGHEILYVKTEVTIAIDPVYFQTKWLYSGNIRLQDKIPAWAGHKRHYKVKSSYEQLNMWMLDKDDKGNEQCDLELSKTSMQKFRDLKATITICIPLMDAADDGGILKYFEKVN